MALAGRKVAVVGGGVGGVAAALALARRGADVTVFERAPVLGEVGAGLQIAPNGVAVLAALGVAERLSRLVTVPEAIEMRAHRGDRLVARVPLGATAVARYGRPYWHVHRADLLATLADAAIAAGVRMRLGQNVDGQDLAGQGVCGQGGAALADAEVVVAADGVRSQLRAPFGGGPARFAGHVAWRGLVWSDRLPVDLARPAARVWLGPGRHLVAYPLRGGRLVNFVAVVERDAWAEESWSLPGDPEEMRRAFAGFEGSAGLLLRAVSECFFWGLFDHAALPRWTDGRLVLLGDACHPMLPFVAQGATMALEDAWVLAATLDAAEDPAVGLARYEALRRPRTTRVQASAARNARIYHLGGTARLPLHAGLRMATAVAPTLLLGRFDWLFGRDVTLAG